MFSDSEHIPFFDYILARWQRLDDDPRLLLGLFTSANDGEDLVLFVIVLLIVGAEDVDSCICPLDFIFIFVFVVVGSELVVAIEFEYPGLIYDTEHFLVDLLGRSCIVKEVGVSFLPGFADNLAE